jgi:hypothetical protein
VPDEKWKQIRQSPFKKSSDHESKKAGEKQENDNKNVRDG